MATFDKLMAELPKYWEQSPQMKEIQDAAATELDRLNGETAEIYTDGFIMTASDSRIREWERRLNIPPTGTLDDRRRRILGYFQTISKLTEEVIQTLVSTLYYGAAATVEFSDSTIKIEISPTPDHAELTEFPLVAEQLEIKKPCHIGLQAYRWYCTWQIIHDDFTRWGTVQLYNSTWLDVTRYIPEN